MISCASVFGQRLLREIALDVDVEESRDTTHRHRGAVHLLDRAEVAEIGPLHGFARVRRGPADVEAVRCRHRLEVGERAHLVGHVHAQLHHGFRRPAGVDLRALRLLRRDQAVHAIQRHAAVIADDAPAPVGVRQPGDDAGFPARANLRRVEIEHRIVVRLAVFGEGLAHRGIRLEARRLEPVLDHLVSARGHDRAAKRLVGLQADDHLVVLIDVARPVRSQRRRRLRVHVEHALLRLLAEVRLELLPHGAGPRGRPDEESFVARIRRHVGGNEVAHVDVALPGCPGKIAPRIGLLRRGFRLGAHGDDGC